jgi:hypothetical protein
VGAPGGSRHDAAAEGSPSGARLAAFGALDIGYFDMKDTTDISRTVVRHGEWCRVHFVARSFLVGAVGGIWTLTWIAIRTEETNPVSGLVGPIIILGAMAMLWRALKRRPGSTRFEFDRSGIVLHVSPRMRKLETPVVLPWTDIAVIRRFSNSHGGNLSVRSRDGVWHRLPVFLSSPAPHDVIERMLAVVKDQGIRVEQKYTFMVIGSRTEWRLTMP